MYQNDYDLIQNVLGTRVALNVNTKEASIYWLASRYYIYTSSINFRYYGCHIFKDGAWGGNDLYGFSGGSFNPYSNKYTIRPIIILKSGISYTRAIGTMNDPFILN